jgi:arylsulfatase A-like enzyme
MRRLILAASLCFVSAVAGADRPNVLLILSDDLRPQLGCYGDRVVQTPHLDRFAESAMVFHRAYVQCAICSPSRNSLLSGLRPNTTSLRSFGTTIREAVPDVVTLPQHFKRHGYHAAAFGKVFHVYAETILGSEDDPQSWSQPLYLPRQPVWGPQQEELRNRLIAEARAAGKEFVHPHDWPRAETWDAPDVADDDLQDGEIASRAIEFLQSRDADDPPFFLAVGFLKPHLPFVAPRRYWDLYDPGSLPLPENQYPPVGSPPWAVNRGVVKNYANMPPPEEIDDDFKRRYLQAYLACISYVDACVGRVLAALEEQDLRGNTIVVFLGDHGYQMGEHDSWGHKHSNFETSTRAPLLVSAPGRKAVGASTDSLVEFLDVYPTLCELAALPRPGHVEGESFAAILDDPRAVIHDAVFSEMQRGRRLGRTIRTDSHRYVEWTNPAGQTVARELYDHRSDPQENRSIADQPEMRTIRSEMSRRLNDAIPLNRTP